MTVKGGLPNYEGGFVIGLLGPEEIEAVLQRNQIGRLAVSTNDRPYVVPINYGYDGKYIYGFSGPGRKIDVMREQPLVSFLVDEIDAPTSWRCVVVEAIYEELTDDVERQRAAHTISLNGTGLVSRGLEASSPLIFFRLRPLDKSGRFERSDA
ncbi:MAG TPA: pyridoxamine 5'-phosphate oxidase family protein [Thermomicrobiales bacterium]